MMRCFAEILLWCMLQCAFLVVAQSSSMEHLSLVEIFKRHEGLIVDKWEQYFEVYEDIFSPYRQSNHRFSDNQAQHQSLIKPTSLLEIGVSFGGSLQIWKKYFGPSSIIVGVDINDNVCKNPYFRESGVQTFCFDASNHVYLQKFFTYTIGDAGEAVLLFPPSDTTPSTAVESAPLLYDIIVDDASHVSRDVISTFNTSFQYVSEGGLYIVEDVICSYLPTHDGGFRREDTMIEYFKSLVDMVNSFYAVNRNNLSPLELYLATWIDHIKFADSMIVIKKRHTAKIAGFRRVMSGSIASKGMLPNDDVDHKQALNKRLELTTSLGFYQNGQDIVATDIHTTYTHMETETKSQQQYATAAKITFDARYSTQDTAYVSLSTSAAVGVDVGLDGSTTSDGTSTVPKVLAVELIMDVPTPCKPFYFYSNITTEVSTEPERVDPLLAATKLFCRESRCGELTWSCPGSVLDAVRDASLAFQNGVLMPNNLYVYHIVKDMP